MPGEIVHKGRIMSASCTQSHICSLCHKPVVILSSEAKCDKCSMLQRTNTLAKSRKAIVNLQVTDQPMQKLFIGELLIQSTFGDATVKEVEISIMEGKSSKVTIKLDSSFIESNRVTEASLMFPDYDIFVQLWT
jgi:hypothetical protein